MLIVYIILNVFVCTYTNYGDSTDVTHGVDLMETDGDSNEDRHSRSKHDEELLNINRKRRRDEDKRSHYGDNVSKNKGQRMNSQMQLYHSPSSFLPSMAKLFTKSSIF